MNSDAKKPWDDRNWMMEQAVIEVARGRRASGMNGVGGMSACPSVEASVLDPQIGMKKRNSP